VPKDQATWLEVGCVIGQEWLLGGNAMCIHGLLVLTSGESKLGTTHQPMLGVGLIGVPQSRRKAQHEV
jgi:hypothetical protein